MGIIKVEKLKTAEIRRFKRVLSEARRKRKGDKNMVKKISDSEYKQMDKSGAMLIDFSAGWCGPCRMLAPVLEEVSEEYGDRILFYNVDVDENPDLAQTFAVQSIPALVIMKDGEKLGMQVGFQPKESLKRYIDRYI